ncbi:MAG: RNA methyltransferase [Bacteroidetes bacterium]|nr:RNA methyltransferase [Bacteroidota bacterium]
MRKLKLKELGRLSTEEFKSVEKLPYVVVLDQVRSMHNVGSVFRTADAFRAEKIILCGITGQPPHREITKTAIGAEKSVSWEYAAKTTDALRHLKALGYHIYAVEQTDRSQSLQDIIFSGGKVAFVFGNEIDGIEQEVLEICDSCIEIPQAGTKHSLNISVACGVVLWQYASSRLSQF